MCISDYKQKYLQVSLTANGNMCGTNDCKQKYELASVNANRYIYIYIDIYIYILLSVTANRSVY